MIEMKHYKDQKTLYYHCKSLEKSLIKEKRFIKEIADRCREAYKNNVLDAKVLSDFLIDATATKGKQKTPEHSGCDGFKNTPRSGGEKQICHCMFYFNSDFPKKCKESCDFVPWKKVGEITVDEFEYPSKYKIPGIGGIDLVLKYKNEIYGAEVKPPDSGETVSRMIAEILTYYVVDKNIDFKPAIAVFRGSYQYNIIVKLEKDEDWLEIREHIMVFVIDYKEKKDVKEFSIVPFER